MSDIIEVDFKNKPKDDKKVDKETNLEDNVAKNKENQERLKKDRIKANRKVLRDYRIK